MDRKDILLIVLIFSFGYMTINCISFGKENIKIIESKDILMENYDILRNDYINITKDNYELRMNLYELKWKLYLTEKQIPAYIKHLNNTNNYSSCWTENGTILDKRKDDCYNCQNFTEDYLSHLKDEEYETYYVSGHIKGHEFNHAFAKVCIYVNPTGNALMSDTQLSRYEITKEEKLNFI